MRYSYDDLLSFLQAVDADFNPPLSEKTILKDYVAKICDKARLIIRGDDDSIYGLTVLYCNDVLQKMAYIALVGLKEEYRGQGVAADMMLEAICVAPKAGMQRIGIHSNNSKAVALYQRLGFEIILDDERKYLEYKI